MKTNFVEIKTVKEVRNALSATLTFRFPVLVVGDAGQGKSTALQKIASEDNHFYALASDHVKNASELYRFLLMAIGIGTLKGSKWDLYQQCDINFSWFREGSALFIDEYQALPPTAIREILHFHDKYQFPLVFCGNRERLARTRASSGALDQIESRIGMTFRVDRPDYADCMNIGIEFNVEGTQAYDALAAFGARTSVRELVRLLVTCAAITGGRGSIRLPELKAGVQALHGRPDAVKLFNIHSNA